MWDLYGAGFVVNEEKLVWEPTQVLDTLKIVERRITKITNTIDRIIEADFKLSARELASFKGQMISIAPVVGNIGSILTRHGVMSTLCVDNWDSVFCLDDYCKKELYYWKDNLINLNSRYCFVSKDPSYFVYSDASATGGGAFIDFNNDFVCHKLWTENESLRSSTWRELSVIEFSLQSFAPVLKGSHVKCYTDSQAAAKVVEVGSMRLDLHMIARSIFSICIQSGIYLEVQWIPRTLNQQRLSRLIDTDDRQITKECFVYFLMGVGGPILLIVLPIITITPQILFEILESQYCMCRLLLSASWRRELSRGSTRGYCSTCFALYEMSVCRLYTCCTLLALASAHYCHIHLFLVLIVTHWIAICAEILSNLPNARGHNRL